MITDQTLDYAETFRDSAQWRSARLELRRTVPGGIACGFLLRGENGAVMPTVISGDKNFDYETFEDIARAGWRPWFPMPFSHTNWLNTRYV